MAVIVAKRNKSPVEYVHKARQIADIINSRMEHLLNKISKKYNKYFYIANRVYGYYYEKPVQLAVDSYISLCYANRIRIKDEKTYQRRKTLLKDTIENYNRLINVLSVLFSHFKAIMNMNAIANLTDLIHQEVEEIKLIIKNDDRMYSGLSETP